MPVNHIQCGAALGTPTCLGKIALNDPPSAVFHQGMSHEAGRSTRAGGSLVKARLGVGLQGMGGI
jgi:hypothetical protein